MHGRRRRHARKSIAAQVINDAKNTDLTPTEEPAWELRRTLTIPAPASDEYIIIRKIEGEVTFGATITSQQGSVTARLGYRLGTTGPITTLVQDSAFGTQVVTRCSDNVFKDGSVDLDHRLPLGEGLAVQFHQQYEVTGAPVVDRVCLRGTRVTYDVIRLALHGSGGVT